MGPNARELLNKLKLPYAKEIDLVDALSMNQKELKLYLRYNLSEKDKNKVVNLNYIKENLRVLYGEIVSGQLEQISEYIKTLAGVVISVQKTFVYGEFVMGEPAMILRRGRCKRRFILCNGKTRFLDYPQKYIFLQEYGIINNTFLRSEIDNIFCQTIEELKYFLNEIPSDYLLEAHVTRNGIVFTDAKINHEFILTSDLKKIFGKKNQIVVLKGKFRNRVNYDKLDIDYDLLNKSVAVRKGALLSHYITYYFDRIENIFIES